MKLLRKIKNFFCPQKNTRSCKNQACKCESTKEIEKINQIPLAPEENTEKPKKKRNPGSARSQHKPAEPNNIKKNKEKVEGTEKKKKRTYKRKTQTQRKKSQ
jgi:hypothetical protein